jgi:elongation factor G
VLKAGPIVLEPIVKVEIAAPEAHMGDITGDLSSKRGQINGTRALSAGALAVLGQAPLSELNGYQARLHALTAGRASYTVELSHYEAVPPSVQQQLVAQFRPRDEE